MLIGCKYCGGESEIVLKTRFCKVRCTSCSFEIVRARETLDDEEELRKLRIDWTIHQFMPDKK
jgi:hypothetical protein